MNPFYNRKGLNVETYDARTRRAGFPMEGDAAFYLEEARSAGRPVLELGSGTGRVTWEIGFNGIEITGLDRSQPMMEAAQAKAVSFGDGVRRRVNFVLGDMRTFRIDKKFAMVIVPFRGFQALLSPEDQLACLKSVSAHLFDGGRLIVNLFDPRLDLCQPQAPSPMERTRVTNPATNLQVEVDVVKRTTDPVRQLMTEVWKFTERDSSGTVWREERETLEMRWTYRQEARYLFEKAGFAVVAEYSDFKRSKPAYGKEQVWVLRKV